MRMFEFDEVLLHMHLMGRKELNQTNKQTHAFANNCPQSNLVVLSTGDVSKQCKPK